MFFVEGDNSSYSLSQQNVNLEETMDAISRGIKSSRFVERITVSTGFPIIRRPISPKQIISASSVPSPAMKLSLYLVIVGKQGKQ